MPSTNRPSQLENLLKIRKPVLSLNRKDGLGDQVSTPSTFYVKLFRTKVFFAAFQFLRCVSVFSGKKKLAQKALRKLLEKLTIEEFSDGYYTFHEKVSFMASTSRSCRHSTVSTIWNFRLIKERVSPRTLLHLILVLFSQQTILNILNSKLGCFELMCQLFSYFKTT